MKERKKNSLESSSQQAEQVQLVACGKRIPSSIKAWRLRPPKRIDLFQSLLEPRPHKFSNSLGVSHCSLYLIHLPRPPEPKRLLYNSAVVVLHRIGRTSMFIVSVQPWLALWSDFSTWCVDVEVVTVSGTECCCITMCAVFISSPADRKLYWFGNVSMTLSDPKENEPPCRDTGTDTTCPPGSVFVVT